MYWFSYWNYTQKKHPPREVSKEAVLVPRATIFFYQHHRSMEWKETTYRMQCHLFTWHWITKASIVIWLVLQSLPTRWTWVALYSVVAPPVLFFFYRFLFRFWGKTKDDLKFNIGSLCPQPFNYSVLKILIAYKNKRKHDNVSAGKTYPKSSTYHVNLKLPL